MSAWKEWQDGLISEGDYKADCDLDDWRADIARHKLGLVEDEEEDEESEDESENE